VAAGVGIAIVPEGVAKGNGRRRVVLENHERLVALTARARLDVSRLVDRALFTAVRKCGPG
jgi:hypothetical protein